MVPAGQTLLFSPQGRYSQSSEPWLHTSGWRQPAILQPPPPAQSAPAATAVTAASVGPPACVQGPVGYSQYICDAQPDAQPTATNTLAQATGQQLRRDGASNGARADTGSLSATLSLRLFSAERHVCARFPQQRPCRQAQSAWEGSSPRDPVQSRPAPARPCRRAVIRSNRCDSHMCRPFTPMRAPVMARAAWQNAARLRIAHTRPVDSHEFEL
jgi:hypothetical protein